MNLFLLCIGVIMGTIGWCVGRVAHIKSPPGFGKRINAPFWVNIIAGFFQKDYQLVDFALYTQLLGILTSGLSILVGLLGQNTLETWGNLVCIIIIGIVMGPFFLIKWIKTRSETDIEKISDSKNL